MFYVKVPELKVFDSLPSLAAAMPRGICMLTMLTFMVLTVASIAMPAIAVTGAGTTLPLNLYQDATMVYTVVEPTAEIVYSSDDSGGVLCRLMDNGCDLDGQTESWDLDFVGLDLVPNGTISNPGLI